MTKQKRVWVPGKGYFYPNDKEATNAQLPPQLAGRCATCRFWIDAEQMQHAQPDADPEIFNQHRRECWAENPSVVPSDRRAMTGPFDLCRHWTPSQG
jgi:hypothetical protein